MYYKGQRGEGVYDVAFEGLIKNVERRYRETGSDATKQEYETFMRITPCPACKGQRLKPEALAVTVGDKNIYEVTSLSISSLQEFLNELKLTPTQEMIGEQVLKKSVPEWDFWSMLDWIILPFQGQQALFPAEKPREYGWPLRSAPGW